MGNRSAELDKFLDYLETEDNLAALLRVHLYVEAGLISVIEEALEHPEYFKVSNLRFPQKVDLSIAMGLFRPEERQPLLLLNSLRNKLAHQIGKEITDSDVREIFDSFDEWMTTIADGVREGRGDYHYTLRTILLAFVMRFNHDLSNQLVEAGSEPSTDDGEVGRQ